MENDIQYNIENRIGKTECISVYVTPQVKEAVERYTDIMGTTQSDWVGGLIWPALKAAYQLPEDYSQPPGF